MQARYGGPIVYGHVFPKKLLPVLLQNIVYAGQIDSSGIKFSYIQFNIIKIGNYIIFDYILGYLRAKQFQLNFMYLIPLFLFLFYDILMHSVQIT